MKIENVKVFLENKKEGEFYKLKIIIEFDENRRINFTTGVISKIKIDGEWNIYDLYEIFTFLKEFKFNQATDKELRNIVEKLYDNHKKCANEIKSTLEDFIKKREIY